MKMKDRLHISCVRWLLYLLLAGAFFGVQAIGGNMSVQNWRNVLVCMLMFLMGFGMLTNIYGGCQIGKRPCRAMENSLMIASWLTDLLTFLQMMILNVEKDTSAEGILGAFGLLFFSMALQGMCILILVPLGVKVYQKATRMNRTLYITNPAADSKKLLAGIERKMLERSIDAIMDYQEEDLYEQILEYDNIFISEVPLDVRQKIIEYSYKYEKNIFFAPEICDIIEVTSEQRMFDDTLILASPKKELSLFQIVVKRTCDIVFGFLFLVLSSPLFLFGAVLIKLDDHGKVFFRQQRATKDGKPFWILKLRTMKEHEITSPMLENDNRVTRAGKFLRRTRIDELPQFLNVIKGDMSLVGPRPEQLAYLHGFEGNYPEYEYRLRVKAGMTGFAQIEGKYNTTNQEKLLLDLMYIQNYSLWLDVKLVLQTILVMLKDDSTEGF